MLLHGRDLSPEAAKARREAEVRGGRKEGLNRPNRTAVEDAEGHARAAPTAAVGGGRLDGEGRDWPRPLRALPPASGSRRSDTGGNLLQTNASASLRDPASPRPGGRRPDGSAVSRRLPRCGAVVAATASKSSLRGPSPEGNVGRRVRARRHRSDRRCGLCAPTAAAIPIAPLQPPLSPASGGSQGANPDLKS